MVTNQNDFVRFGGLYPHAKFQVILLGNFEDMSNFKTCRNAVGFRVTSSLPYLHITKQNPITQERKSI